MLPEVGILKWKVEFHGMEWNGVELNAQFREGRTQRMESKDKGKGKEREGEQRQRERRDTWVLGDKEGKGMRKARKGEEGKG